MFFKPFINRILVFNPLSFLKEGPKVATVSFSTDIWLMDKNIYNLQKS